jgi:heme exporter protein D
VRKLSCTTNGASVLLSVLGFPDCAFDIRAHACQSTSLVPREARGASGGFGVFVPPAAVSAFVVIVVVIIVSVILSLFSRQRRWSLAAPVMAMRRRRNVRERQVGAGALESFGPNSGRGGGRSRP